MHTWFFFFTFVARNINICYVNGQRNSLHYNPLFFVFCRLPHIFSIELRVRIETIFFFIAAASHAWNKNQDSFIPTKKFPHLNTHLSLSILWILLDFAILFANLISSLRKSLISI